MLKSIVRIILAATAMAQVKYKFEEEEFLLNRAAKDIDSVKLEKLQETTANYYKTFKLTHKFLNEERWEERS